MSYALPHCTHKENQEMGVWSLILISCLISFYYILASCATSSEDVDKVYIVYLGHGAAAENDNLITSRSHVRLLANLFESEEEAMGSMVYSYTRSFSGFAAKLNPSRARALAEMEGVVSVFESRMLELHTTRSWDFMGLRLDHDAAVPNFPSIYGDDVIVGILDTGIWPESKSFREEPGMRPIPSSWKGKCIGGNGFDPRTICNRKLIGAKYYVKGFEQQYGPLNTADEAEYRSPRDRLGHGTHTSSTAVGSIVPGASFDGLGLGTARGGEPRARLAVYKVCWSMLGEGKCNEADIMAAFEEAISDGVHVISGSFGMLPPLLPFFAYSISIGSFHAMQKGISVVLSAGNYNPSPEPSFVQNVAPWSISVAASTIDRDFPAKIVLDNNASFMGESLMTKRLKAELASSGTFFGRGRCRPENWMNVSASGKVILCFSTAAGATGELVTSSTAVAAVLTAGGAGLIYVESVGRQIPDIYPIPVVYIDFYQGTKIRHLLGFSPSISVVVTPSKAGVIGTVPAPAVAYFSCRGPSSLSPDILKPDITAPGVNILAAWPPNTPIGLSGERGQLGNWNFLSGTSMSCPHVTGAVALIKSAHPDWSPAMIRSALMTTAYTSDTSSETIRAGGSRKPSDPFDVGAGHMDPVKAMDPGLVYDMTIHDYIIFLCNIGYSTNLIKDLVIPGTFVTCPQFPTTNSDLNYPSITVTDLRRTISVKRTARNVGRERNAIYFARVVSPNGVEVSVWPRVMIFSWFTSENTYYVTMKPTMKSKGKCEFGEIVWSDGFHSVRSPLSVCVNNVDSDRDDTFVNII
ncbi:hypothetical protein MLD38_011812 [Melastoma candidum]|uniref:Uncharacterized protein n=1 Tax=Melastoma candidum TaxID=119954 RepID=A0ACB9R3V9_9MYRT|nr:hypothetical protein MLD38_011812 [Melastoma candidum]